MVLARVSSAYINIGLMHILYISGGHLFILPNTSLTKPLNISVAGDVSS